MRVPLGSEYVCSDFETVCPLMVVLLLEVEKDWNVDEDDIVSVSVEGVHYSDSS